MRILIGFIIALCVGLTGVGGGSFTTPALVLISGISGADAVGTALVFSTIVRLTAAPFYVAARHIHFRYLRFMLLGAVPGLLGGTYLLAVFNTKSWNPVILIGIGVTLVLTATFSFFARQPLAATRQDSAPWLPWLTLPIGVETGFSSAGAGALGTMLLLNCSDMPTSQVVGTDLVFGIALAGVGAAFHFTFGSISVPALRDLLLGGIPGVLLGCKLAPKVPSRNLRVLIAVITLVLGMQLVWSGARLAHKPDAAGNPQGEEKSGKIGSLGKFKSR